VVSEQVNIQVYGGEVINSHCVMFITLWCGVWQCQILFVSLYWCP